MVKINSLSEPHGGKLVNRLYSYVINKKIRVF
jgi:hypothetical protein